MNFEKKQKSQNEIYASGSPAQTKKIGMFLAKEILKTGPAERARILALAGELGAGKTNFVQGFAKELGVKDVVNSPTFSIMKKYPLPAKSGFANFYHIDCYRLSGAADLELLGSEKIFADPKNIVAIEWPEKSQKMLFSETTWIFFKSTGFDKRELEVSVGGSL